MSVKSGEVHGKTVLQRRDRLEQIITPVPGIQVGGYMENHGTDLCRLAKEKGLEGIIDQFLFGQARSAT